MKYQVQEDELLTKAVIHAVSTFEGVEPLDLPPLGDVLDPDGLDVIFAEDALGAPKSGGWLSFIYSDSWVTVENGEYLEVHSLHSAGAEPDQCVNR